MTGYNWLKRALLYPFKMHPKSKWALDRECQTGTWLVSPAREREKKIGHVQNRALKHQFEYWSTLVRWYDEITERASDLPEPLYLSGSVGMLSLKTPWVPKKMGSQNLW